MYIFARENRVAPLIRNRVARAKPIFPVAASLVFPLTSRSNASNIGGSRRVIPGDAKKLFRLREGGGGMDPPPGRRGE